MSVRLFLPICLIVLSMTTSLRAQIDPGRFSEEVYKNAEGKELKYRLLKPQVPSSESAASNEERFPLVLFLHGAGERGDNNLAQLFHVARELDQPELSQRYPAFVIAPQCPNDHRWVEIDWDSDAHTMPEQPSEDLQLVFELLQQACETLPIDRNRIYVVGLSMGGFGSWDLLQRHPDFFAAGIPICGGGDIEQTSQLTTIPIWVFHGDQDTLVKPLRSRNMVTAIRQAGGDKILYTEYEGVGHDSWTQTAKNRLVWDWLFQQKKQSQE